MWLFFVDGALGQMFPVPLKPFVAKQNARRPSGVR